MISRTANGLCPEARPPPRGRQGRPGDAGVSRRRRDREADSGGLEQRVDGGNPPESDVAYALRREGTNRRFRIEFALSKPVAVPPALGSEVARRHGSAADSLQYLQAGVAELADAADLKSADPKGSSGFDSRPRHTNPPHNCASMHPFRGFSPLNHDFSAPLSLPCAWRLTWGECTCPAGRDRSDIRMRRTTRRRPAAEPGGRIRRAIRPAPDSAPRRRRPTTRRSSSSTSHSNSTIRSRNSTIRNSKNSIRSRSSRRRRSTRSLQTTSLQTTSSRSRTSSSRMPNWSCWSRCWSLRCHLRSTSPPRLRFRPARWAPRRNPPAHHLQPVPRYRQAAAGNPGGASVPALRHALHPAAAHTRRSSSCRSLLPSILKDPPGRSAPPR